MTIFILLLIAIVAIIIFTAKSKNKTQFNITKPQDNNYTVGTVDNFKDEYEPYNIQRTGLQALETVHIIGTSKSIDTIKGRFDFLTQIITTLQKAQNNARYLSDAQQSIDKYKSLYYERIPQKDEISLLLKPKDFNLINFYCNSLLIAFERNFEEHNEQIKSLKREDAKRRRIEKVKELLKFTKDEVNNNCSGAESFLSTISELERFEKILGGQNFNFNSSIDSENKTSDTKEEIQSNKLITKYLVSNGIEFVLNPNSKFSLTLLGADQSLGEKIQKILMSDNPYDYKNKDQIAALFAEYNLRIKEVETYKHKYGKIYFDKIETLKISSIEWQTSGELDKDDLLGDFREIAIKEIYERANCNLHLLFENEPRDIEFDDDLIKEYGFENVQTYLRFAAKIDKVRVIANENYNRKKFEKLVEMGLAIRGSVIPLKEILATLTLKELNEIANNSDKDFKRKNQAIDFIIEIPNIEEKLSSKISFREIFKLNKLPEKFSSINLKEVSDGWSYTYEVVGLLIETFNLSNYALRVLEDDKYVKEYTLINNSNIEKMCPRAKELISKKYKKSTPPKIPYHIGCNCVVGKEFEPFSFEI